MSLLMIAIALFGAGLIATGLFYQFKRQQLNSDPVLITACYIWGGVNIASCLV